MKILLVLSFFLPALSYADFSLSSIHAIECVDASTSDINVFFSTGDAAAQKYHRRPDTIPYDYGNKTSPYYSAQSGQMKLNNNPDAEGGVISLIDAWDPENLSTLVLQPTANVGAYTGVLSGHVAKDDVWIVLPAHQLNCIVN